MDNHMNKDFRQHFYMFLNKLKTNENFAFCRFSDGEMFMMQNKKLVLNDSVAIIDQNVHSKSYAKEDHKDFDPSKHSFYRERLMESYKFKKHNYYVGLCCRCCQGQQNFDWMIRERGGDDENLTWANIWVNGNYPLFIQEVVPVFKDKKIVLVFNEKSNLNGLPFKYVKNFTIGSNCIVNDYPLIEKMKQWISENNIQDHVFLFSASTLSNFLAHQLYEFNDKNTYIDIGTTLNYYVNLTIDRDYILEYFSNKPRDIINKVCIW